MILFNEFVKDELIARGLSKEHTEDFLTEWSGSDKLNWLWGIDIEHYSRGSKKILFMTIENSALEYMNKNCPETKYIRMFDGYIT